LCLDKHDEVHSVCEKRNQVGLPQVVRDFGPWLPPFSPFCVELELLLQKNIFDPISNSSIPKPFWFAFVNYVFQTLSVELRVRFLGLPLTHYLYYLPLIPS
jgi:hypothetical protein